MLAVGQIRRRASDLVATLVPMSDDYVWRSCSWPSSTWPPRTSTTSISACKFQAIMLAFDSDPLREPSAAGTIADAMARIQEERAAELAKSIVSLYDSFLRTHRTT